MKLTNQTAFTKFAVHLLKQGRKSEDEISCLYRGPNSTSCAVGCLIPDEMYTRSIEGLKAGDLLCSYGKIRQLFKNVDHTLLYDLQDIHDDLPVEKWKKALKELAKKRSLDFSKVEKSIQ